jgi:hypothetical protein
LNDNFIVVQHREPGRKFELCIKICAFVGFEVFTAVTMKNAVFWGVAPCRCGRSYTGFRQLPADLHRPFPTPLYLFPCATLPPHQLIYIAGSLRLAASSAATCSRWFFARGFFYPEDGGDTILQNVGSIDHIYTASHPRRRHSSLLKVIHFKV